MADPPDSRVSSRSNVYLMALLSAEGRSWPVRVRNISTGGALLEGSSLPGSNLQARLIRGSLSADGLIVWQQERFCGIRFNSDVEVGEWIQRAGPVGQQRIDEVIAEFRQGNPGDPRRAPRSSPSPRENLDDVAHELERIAERIAGLPGMSTELAEEVVRIEVAAQRIRSKLL